MNQEVNNKSNTLSSPSSYPSDVDPFVQTFSSSAHSMSVGPSALPGNNGGETEKIINQFPERLYGIWICFYSYGMI